MSLTVKEILKKWLKDNGYGGLYSDYMECGCNLEDLLPCEEVHQDCRAGVEIPCDGSCPEGSCDSHIVPKGEGGGMVTKAKEDEVFD